MRNSTVIDQRGFSLVELMVAIVLGLILIAGVLQVFLGNRQAQTSEQSIARVQESGRLALGFLEDDLRATGFYGAGNPSNSVEAPTGTYCTPARPSKDVLNVSNLNQFNNFRQDSVRSFSKSATGTWAPALDADIPAAVAAAARNGSDLLVVFYGEMTDAVLAAGIGGTNDIVVKRNNACFGNGDLVALAGLQGGVILRVSNTPSCIVANATLEHKTTGSFNCTDNLGPYKYDTDARILKMHYAIYYVADTNRDNSDGNPVYSLYRYSAAGTSSTTNELVEGVEFLEVTFGERLTDADGKATGNIRYDTFGSIVNRQNIVSAYVGILAQGIDRARTDDDANTYVLPGISIPGSGSGTKHDGGKVYRRVFTSNIELRNRAL